MRWTFALLLAAACHHEPDTMHPKPGDLPPLPPASGTPIGYLIDAAGDLGLRPDQLDHLKQIDASLAARDAEIDTQLRQLERPEEDEQPSPQQRKAGMKAPRHNNAPGAQVVSKGDAGKLHKMRDANDRDALKQAWALLDDGQQTGAKKILQDRGVGVPGESKKNDQPDPDDGRPVPGLEP